MSAANTLPERIAAIFSDALHLEIESFETDLFDSGVLDSMAFVELLLHLEREFGLTTSVDDLAAENFRSITCIADFIQSRGLGTSVHAASVIPIAARS